MYLRSSILLLLMVANIGAVDRNLCVGAAELAVGVSLGWLAKEGWQVSNASISQMCESKRELKKMGAKVKKTYIAVDRSVLKVPSHIKKYPHQCSQEDKETIDKHFSDLQFAFIKQLVCGIGSVLLMGASVIVGVDGATAIYKACQS